MPRTPEESMHIIFLGGASEIGASCALISLGHKSFLIDCGIRFSPKNPLPDLDQLTGKHLDAILITHAHSDHTGALPIVHDAFPSVPIYMTPPTMDLVSILQRDALRLMDQAEREFEIPMYSEKQVDSMLKNIVPIQHGQRIPIDSVIVTFLPAGHILGASMIHLETPAGNVLFTGDYSMLGQSTVPDLKRPGLLVDCVVTESTYGDRMHSDRKLAEKRLVQQISDVIGMEGKVLLPAFAIGRAQEILLILKYAMRRKSLPKIPIYVDGMVRSVCGSYASHQRYVSKQLSKEITANPHPFFSDMITPVRQPAEREKIVTGGPSVIIASSGMLQGGPSSFYASRLVEDERNAILITGYQDEEAPGRVLQNLAGTRDKQIRLGNKELTVACQCETYTLSAHADRMQISGFIETIHPRSVLLVHGSDEARTTLKNSFTDRDIVMVEEGVPITRSYPVRKKKTVGPLRAAPIMTINAATSLLGPATGQPLVLKDVCDAWFGRKTNTADQESLLRQLFEFKLVVRDSENPDLIWPLTKPALITAPTPEETALEEQLKSQNPNSRLHAFCSQRKIKRPQHVSSYYHNQFVAEYRITLNGETIASGPQFGHSETTANQLAAQSLLKTLIQHLMPDVYTTVDDEQSRLLKLQNPKSNLLEWCVEHQFGNPKVTSEAVPDGFLGNAVISLPNTVVVQSGFYLAPTVKTAEQAACADLLQKLLHIIEHPDQFQSPVPSDPSGKESLMPLPLSVDPRVQLNTMKQSGEIVDFGYELLDRQGESHQPLFSMRGWYERPNRGICYTKTITAGNKKECQRQCAMLIFRAIQMD